MLLFALCLSLDAHVILWSLVDRNKSYSAICLIGFIAWYFKQWCIAVERGGVLIWQFFKFVLRGFDGGRGGFCLMVVLLFSYVVCGVLGW